MARYNGGRFYVTPPPAVTCRHRITCTRKSSDKGFAIRASLLVQHAA